MKYFKLTLTESEAQMIFTKLSKALHPDTAGADGQEFADMKSEYDDYKAIRRRWSSIKELVNATVRRELMNRPPKIEYRTEYVERQIPVQKAATIETVGNFIGNVSAGINVANSLLNTLGNLFPSETASLNDDIS